MSKGKAKTKPGKTPASKAKPARKPAARATKSARGAPVPSSQTHAERFEREPYELPMMDLGEAIALASSLVSAKLAKATPAIDEELRRVSAARSRAQSIRERLGAGNSAESVDARAYDVAMDRAWETFVRRIEDHVELPAEHHGHSPDGARIYAIVSDLSILKLNYLAEFAQIGARLDSMKREGLLEAARMLAGTEFVDEVLRCHAEYGRALGVMGAPRDAAVDGREQDRGEARNALSDAIAEYAVQVLALARAGQADSWPPVAKALKPILDLRTRMAGERRTQAAPRQPPAHPPVPAPAPPTQSATQ